jgi:hypothetical protein
MPQIPDFLPSTHGLHFSNWWPPGTPDIVVNVPIVGEVAIGDAGNGLCGGMAFTVADLYLGRLRPPPETTPPAGGTPLFDYLVNRLMASFNIPSGVLTYYYWANTPDHDTGVWPVIRSGLARMTVVDQVPQITASIDRGQPAALGLVTVRSLNPGDLGRCHQVLAYGYDWDGPRVQIRVYDPNQPDADNITISLDTSNPAHTTQIDSTVACDPIRGFFYTDYGYADPSSVAGTSWDHPDGHQSHGWAAEARGVLHTTDSADVIQYEIEHDGVGGDAVEYVLVNNTASGWRKELRIPNGLLVADGKGATDRNGNWVSELPTTQLVFRKAKSLGLMSDVLTVGEVDQLKPGDRVTFTWMAD